MSIFMYIENNINFQPNFHIVKSFVTHISLRWIFETSE
jgi:hypothetical protein